MEDVVKLFVQKLWGVSSPGGMESEALQWWPLHNNYGTQGGPNHGNVSTKGLPYNWGRTGLLRIHNMWTLFYVNVSTLSKKWVEVTTVTFWLSCETCYTRKYCLFPTTHPCIRYEQLNSPHKLLNLYACNCRMNTQNPVAYMLITTTWTRL